MNIGYTEKGHISELAIQKHILSLGMNVFVPIADVNQVDLIVEVDEGVFSRVQVKGIFSPDRNETSIAVKLKKYSANKVDVIAVYYNNDNKEIIAFIPYFGEDNFQLAISNAKNNQIEGRKWIYAYSDFPKFLANKKKYKGDK